jgi:hypothetical protein
MPHIVESLAQLAQRDRETRAQPILQTVGSVVQRDKETRAQPMPHIVESLAQLAQRHRETNAQHMLHIVESLAQLVQRHRETKAQPVSQIAESVSAPLCKDEIAQLTVQMTDLSLAQLRGDGRTQLLLQRAPQMADLPRLGKARSSLSRSRSRSSVYGMSHPRYLERTKHMPEFRLDRPHDQSKQSPEQVQQPYAFDMQHVAPPSSLGFVLCNKIKMATPEHFMTGRVKYPEFAFARQSIDIRNQSSSTLFNITRFDFSTPSPDDIALEIARLPFGVNRQKHQDRLARSLELTRKRNVNK